MSGFLCVIFLDRPSGGSNIVENASNATMELWLSALSPEWWLLAALLSHFSLNHPDRVANFFCHEARSRAYNNRALCCTCTNNSAVASTTVVYKSAMRYSRKVCVLGTPSSY